MSSKNFQRSTIEDDLYLYHRMCDDESSSRDRQLKPALTFLETSLSAEHTQQQTAEVSRFSHSAAESSHRENQSQQSVAVIFWR